MVYGAGGGDSQSVFVQDGHVRGPEVIRGGGLHVGVVGAVVGAVGRNHRPDAINEGGIDQMIRSLEG